MAARGKNGKRVATERMQWRNGCVCMSLHTLVEKTWRKKVLQPLLKQKNWSRGSDKLKQ